MEYLHIGSADRQLYGVYHSPAGCSGRDMGIVLCYPLGQEYIRSHRSFVNLGNRLADAGFHVLRFDYFGTGDSAGVFGDLRLGSCLDDIATAARELKETCGLGDIALVGLRLGATFAYLSARNMHLKGLVLWSPVWNGRDYLHDISRGYRSWLNSTFTKEKTVREGGSIDSFGYRFGRELVDEIGAIRFTDKVVRAAPVLLIDNEDSRGFWLKKEGDVDKSIVPVKDIEAITAWLCEIDENKGDDI